MVNFANNSGWLRLVKWLIILLLIATVFFWLSTPEKIIVDIVHPTIGNIESKVANTRAGTVTACKRAKLSLPIGGQIAKIHVIEGQLVVEQQLLLTLWNKDRSAVLQEAKAILQATKKRQQRSCIIADNLHTDANRQQHLLTQDLTSEEALDSAIANAKAAQANCEASIAEVEAKQAQVNTVNARLEQTFLYAPFTGTVAEITGEIGEYTTPSPPGVATPPAIDLLTQDCHYITAPIDEVDAALLTPNLPVNIRLDAFRDKVFPGTLRRVSPYVQDFEKQARTVTVEVDINKHQSPHFLAGYSADVEVILNSKDNVLLIPTDLIINQQYVLILNSENIIEQREVKVGLSNWQSSEIISGLTLQDRVISSIGLAKLKPGVSAELKVE